jgi:hypothetical protein
MIILGIDPGKHGAVVKFEISSPEWSNVFIYEFAKVGEEEIINVFKNTSKEMTTYNCSLHCFIEQVHGMPTDSGQGAFNFGMNYGFYQTLIKVFNIPSTNVSPLKWQTAMRCKTGGDKNITKALATQLFPLEKVNLDNADALLIALYGYRLLKQ